MSNSVNNKLRVFTYLMTQGVSKNNATIVSNKTGNLAKAQFYIIAKMGGLTHPFALNVMNKTNGNQMKSFATSFKSFKQSDQNKVIRQYFNFRRQGNNHNKAVNRVFGSFFGSP